ncbi:hypothetical protein [Streptomyces melanogenes]|uniref:hypothetical protein n=1 Tax=Streptomyces melanogenes TaxID=67326 RepID=UPI0037916819
MTRGLGVSLLLAALTACSGTKSPNDDASTSPTTSSTEAQPTPESAPTPQPALAMGREWAFESVTDGIQGVVTVIDYKQGIRSVASAEQDAGSPGYEWAYLELKTCSTSGSFSATTDPWTLAYEDGSRFEASSTTYDDFPKPEYPAETRLTTGKCVRGKLVFAVPGKDWPSTVVYSPTGLKIPQEWQIPTES